MGANRKKLRKEHMEIWDGLRYCWFSQQEKDYMNTQRNKSGRSGSVPKCFYKLEDGSIVEITYVSREAPVTMRPHSDIVFLGMGTFSHVEPYE